MESVCTSSVPVASSRASPCHLTGKCNGIFLQSSYPRIATLRESSPGPQYIPTGRQHVMFRSRRKAIAGHLQAVRKLPFQRQPNVGPDEFRRQKQQQQKQLQLTKQQQTPFGARRKSTAPPTRNPPSTETPEEGDTGATQRPQLPHEAQRQKAFKSLLHKYEIHDRDPEDLVKFEEHLSFAFRDYVRLAEAKQLNHLLSCSEARLERCLSFYHDEFGMDGEELRKLVLKYPRIFGYGVDTSVVPRMEFFEELGIHQSRLKKVLMRSPCVVLNYDVEESLQPRVSFLEDILDACPEVSEKRRNLSARLQEESSGDEEVDAWASVSSMSSGSTWDEPLAPTEPGGPPPESLVAQVILRHPPVLTLTPEHMQVRVDFLAALGLSEEDIGSVVRKHPQILQYSIERMQGIADFLDDMGVPEEGIQKIVTWFPQVMSLSLEKNLRPKCEFLEEEIGDAARLVVVRPSFLGMSLDRRIRPRIEFLKAMDLPFNMNYLGISEAKFQEKMEHVIDSSGDLVEADFERRVGDLIEM